MTRLALLTATYLLTALAARADAQHIFDRCRSSQLNLYRDTQARDVGDLLTVLVQESTDVNNQDRKALKRSTQSGRGLDLSTAFSGDFGTLAGGSTFDSQHEDSGAFDGSSRYSVKRGFVDQITVTVRHVLPNGNLVVSGTRRRRIAGEIRTLQVSGVVRPLDVRNDNTVLSQYVGDFRIKYLGDGDETSYSNQGWLGKRLNRWLPF